ncbi:MAG TPA: hypothetical protein VLK29_01540, partial [Luteimonas sp.]|nr:hypothetical protein [Luteimonas sp.]
PRRPRRLVTGLLLIAGIVLLVQGMGAWRGWQLRQSCTGNGGSWDAARSACTFRGGAPAAPSTPPGSP